jgi:glyoxylase I family protein
MPVTGIGGFFFRANEPDALSAWYKTHLGIDSSGHGWHQSAGPTVVAPFSRSTDYFPAEKQWMLNLRVSGLDLLLDELAASGIAIIRKPEWDTDTIGRFARIHDPEGNPIELWEPPAD